VYKNKAIIIGLFSFLMIFSTIQTSEAELWELIIDLSVEKGIINSGETVVVTGTVVNHAYKPIRGAEVFIRTGSETTKVFTDPWGVFKAEFKDFQRIQGTYTVNVIASWYGMTGLSTTQFEVKGDVSPVSALQQQLSTEQARKYLGSKESDFEKDPIGQTLFKYYHGLLDELVLEQKEASKPNAEQLFIEQQQKIAKELREKAIEELKPGFGTYGGYQYENYISSLNPEIKDTIINQLNFTKNTFEEAQKIRDEIIKNGGTIEEARQAYLEMISMTKETLEDFNQEESDEELDGDLEENYKEPVNEEGSEEQ